MGRIAQPYVMYLCTTLDSANWDGNKGNGVTSIVKAAGYSFYLPVLQQISHV